MSFKELSFICLNLILCSAQELSPESTPNLIKETVYDISLYITVPTIVVVVAILLCLFYCILCSCKEQNPTVPFQPVVVSNRNSPLLVSGQSTSLNNSVPQMSDSNTSNSVPTKPQTPHQIQRPKTSTTKRLFGYKRNAKTVPAVSRQKRSQLKANNTSGQSVVPETRGVGSKQRTASLPQNSVAPKEKSEEKTISNDEEFIERVVQQSTSKTLQEVSDSCDDGIQ